MNVTESTLAGNITVNHPSGCGNNDGSLIVDYSSNVFPVEYSLNGSAFSSSGFFGNLSAGEYNVGIREVGGCNIVMAETLTVAGPMNVRVLANSITDNSATVAWDFVSGGGRIRYNLRYRVVGAETWMMEDNINGTSQVLVGLQQDTEYEVEVQTVCLDFDGITSPWSRATFMTARTQGVTCETPSDIYVNIMTAPNMTPTVYWDNVSGAACYDLQYRTVAPLGTWITLQVLDANNPFPLVGLLPNTTYEVRMRAFCTFCNSTNFSAFSPRIPFTTPGDCDPNFTVSINEGVNELVNCGDYTLRYEGQVQANYAFQWFVDGVEIGGATMPEFEVQLSGEYDLRLTVGNCDEVFSNRVRLTIFPRPEVIANVQQNVSCIQGADGVIVAGCVDVPNRPCNLNPFGYSYMISNGSFTSGFQQSGIFTGLAPGTYTVTIRDLETGCEATYSDPQYTTVVAPDMAKFIGLNGASVSTALVEWNSVQGANAYLLSYRPVGSGEQNWTDELFSGGCPFPGSCNYNLEGLQNNTEYEVRIRTRCALGNVLSNWSDTLAFRTLSLPGCGTQSTFDAVPGGIFAVVLDQNTTQLFWNPVIGATCYDVRYRQLGQGDDAWVSIPTTAGSTTTLSNLLANTVYEYEVRSICGTNCAGTPSAWSAGRTFRTLFFKGEEVATTTASDFRVYPNPNNGTFTVSFTAATVGTATVQMYDMTGRQILSQTQEATLGNNAIAVTVNGYAAGIYMLHLNQGGQKQVVKVVLN